MSSKKKPAAKPAPKKTEPTTPKPDMLDLLYWREVAKSLLEDEKDQWEIGKVATALKLQTELFAKNYSDMKRIANREDGKVSVSWSWKIDGSVQPPTVKVNGSFSEKHSMKAESDVADENAPELPGLQTAPQEPEDDEPARVKSADEKE